MNSEKVTEFQRQQYLQAMGVQPWFARFRLPVSAEAKACDWPEPLDAVADQGKQSLHGGQAPSGPQPARLSSLKQSLVADTPVVEKTASTKPAVESSPSPSALAEQAVTGEAPVVSDTIRPAALENPGELPYLRLFVAPVAGQGLVIGELPYLGEPFSRYHQQLLSDLLRACDRLPQEPIELSHFQWPVCESLVAPYGRAGAMEALNGFLRNQLALDQRRWLLLLGPQAAELALDESQPFDQLRGLSQKGEVIRVVTHGLNQLMRLPELKAEAWQDLKALRDLKESIGA